MSELTKRVRAKYPGAYDDLDDAALEKAVLSKHPEYADLAQPEKPAEPAAAEPKSLGGFLGNVATSGGNFVKNTIEGIPAIAKLGGQVIRTAVDPTYARGNAERARQAAPGILHAIVQGAKDRYGSVENIGNTLYTDPVGVLGDVSTLAGGVGLGAKMGGAAKLARAAEAVSGATNPLRAVGAVAEPLARGAGRTIVKATLRAPAAVREEFGGAKGVADAVLNNRVFSEASAQKKLGQSVAQADKMLADAQAAGVAGVPTDDIANAVMSQPRQTTKLRTRLGVPDQTADLRATADAIRKNNPLEIPLTEAQALKREAQDLAYEAGVDNQSVKKAAEIAKAQALRAGIEQRVPEVGPVNARSRELIGAQKAFAAAQDRPRALTNFLSLLGGYGATPLAGLGIKALDSPRLGALAGIGVNSLGQAAASPMTAQAALIARLLGQEDQP